jgi:hypothetical protein
MTHERWTELMNDHTNRLTDLEEAEGWYWDYTTDSEGVLRCQEIEPSIDEALPLP